MSKSMKITKPQATKNLAKKIKDTVKGLYYTSESDAEILPFSGMKTDVVSSENLLAQIKNPSDRPTEEKDFEEFFTSLTQIQDWFGDEEKETANRFSELKKLLEENLKDLKVFKFGQIELDIYAVGLDSESFLMGVKTEAVET